MLTLSMACLLGAAPSVALPGLSAVNISAAEAELYSEVLATHLREQGLQVMTGRDIAAVLGLERQKELVGCVEESTTCTAELAGALGVSGLVVGTVGRLDDEFVVNVKVLSAANAMTLASWLGKASSASEVPMRLSEAAQVLAAQLTGQDTPSSAAGGVSKKWWALLPATVGLAGLGVGIGLQVQARSTYQALVALEPVTQPSAAELRDSGKA